jgi:hypothetical protein
MVVVTFGSGSAFSRTARSSARQREVDKDSPRSDPDIADGRAA